MNIYILSHNITSPFGDSTAANLDALLDGKETMRLHEGERDIPQPFMASLFHERQVESMAAEGLSRMESACIASARRAIKAADIDVGGSRTLLVVSTTKGNVEWLGDGTHDDERTLTATSAAIIAERLGMSTQPIVVDNACVSGVAALITASRMIETGLYDYAVVCGVEIQSKFIVSGFQSLKAVSEQKCRPFDMERNGLNLGEAAATLVLSNQGKGSPAWRIVNGCMRNDAFHLSAPARDGEGARQALAAITANESTEDIAFINAHGTATLFNDQMESKAIERANLGNIPVNGYKGWFGHTMGACGVLETALSMEAADRGIILPTKGFSETGVSGKIEVVSQLRHTDKGSFVKMLSGFGGCNAAILVRKGGTEKNDTATAPVGNHKTHHVHITAKKVDVDGSRIATQTEGKEMLTEIYKNRIGKYPKFYKMDMLSRLGFIASELLLQAEGDRKEGRSDRAVVLVGHSGSLLADKSYLQTISHADDYYPSPERFVYTLPNIVTGEIAIRNKYHGETCFYILPKRDEAAVERLMATPFADSECQSSIGGWIECGDEQDFEADLYIYERIKQ